jgi:hypothetical protein
LIAARPKQQITREISGDCYEARQEIDDLVVFLDRNGDVGAR